MKQSLSCTRLLHLGRLATCSPCWYGALGSKTLHHHLTGIDADVTYVARNDCSGRDGGRTGGAAQTTGGAWLRTRTLRFLSCSLSPSRSPTSFASRCPFPPLGVWPRYLAGLGPSARATASFAGAPAHTALFVYPRVPGRARPHTPQVPRPLQARVSQSRGGVLGRHKAGKTQVSPHGHLPAALYTCFACITSLRPAVWPAPGPANGPCAHAMINTMSLAPTLLLSYSVGERTGSGVVHVHGKVSGLWLMESAALSFVLVLSARASKQAGVEAPPRVHARSRRRLGVH